MAKEETYYCSITISVGRNMVHCSLDGGYAEITVAFSGDYEDDIYYLISLIVNKIKEKGMIADNYIFNDAWIKKLARSTGMPLDDLEDFAWQASHNVFSKNIFKQEVTV